MKNHAFFLACAFGCATTLLTAADWITYEGSSGPGTGKHLVLLSGDEEYRSEEALPMLAKILSQRHGFKCTVLFPVDSSGFINPDDQTVLPGAEALDSADAVVMSLRFRNWPDSRMKHFVDAFERGVPIVALRTSTHAFSLRGDSSYKTFNRFGEEVLGEGWVSHWGRHKREATQGVIEPDNAGHPILRGVRDVFGDTDVYEAYPPADATILMRGRVLKGMSPIDAPADYVKTRASDKKEQGVNDPMMAVAWTRIHKQESGTQNRVFCTTMGSATDLKSRGLRRLIVNAVYWGLKMEVPSRSRVGFVDPFEPTMYGFKSFRRGLKPSDHALGKKLPQGAQVQ